MGIWGTIGGAAAGAGLGMLTAGWDDERQYRQQERMNSLAMKSSKEMGRYNKDLALEMWKDTNFGAQRQEMEKAGLNVGMMYGGSGGVGTTAAVPSGNVSAGSAPTRETAGMGLQAGLQTAMQQAQIENLKANTEKTKVDAAKVAGVDTELAGANVKATIQKALETQMQNEYMGKGAYKDGMTGYEVKYQREAAEMYKTVADTEVAKLNLEQMPTRLQNEVQRVVLEGQRVAIDAVNARTAQERNALTERVEALRRNLALSMQGAELERKDRTNALGEDALNRTMEQKDQDQLMQMLDKVLSTAVPWYEPSTTTSTSTWSESHNDGEGGHRSESGSRQTRHRN